MRERAYRTEKQMLNRIEELEGVSCRALSRVRGLEAEVEQERAAHLDTLKRVEWCVFDGFGNGYCCPECKGFEEHGHRDKCQIDAEIKRLEWTR